MPFINFNGELIKENSLLFAAQNRLRFGDGFFETMRVFKQKIAFADKHQKRIEHNLAVLQMQLHNFEFHKEVAKICEANNTMNGRLRIQFFRNEGVRYLPANNACGFVIETENDGVELYEKHCLEKVGISKNYFKSSHFLGNIKSSSALLNTMAALEAKNNNWNEAVLLNEKQMVCETLSSNIFIVNHNNIILTPPLSSGCVNGVMRSAAIQFLRNQHYTVEETECSKEILLESKEIFLTNASKGVQQVLQIENSILSSNSIASHLVELLNRAINQQ